MQPTPGNPADIAEILTDIKTNLTRLDDLVQDYLSLVRVANLQMEVQEARSGGASLGHRVPSLSGGAGVTIHQESLEELGLVAFHASTLRRALLNLVQNALAALPQGGTVTIAGQRTTTQV